MDLNVMRLFFTELDDAISCLFFLVHSFKFTIDIPWRSFRWCVSRQIGNFIDQIEKN